MQRSPRVRRLRGDLAAELGDVAVDGQDAICEVPLGDGEPRLEFASLRACGQLRDAVGDLADRDNAEEEVAPTLGDCIDSSYESA